MSSTIVWIITILVANLVAFVGGRLEIKGKIPRHYGLVLALLIGLIGWLVVICLEQ